MFRSPAHVIVAILSTIVLFALMCWSSQNPNYVGEAEFVFEMKVALAPEKILSSPALREFVAGTVLLTVGIVFLWRGNQGATRFEKGVGVLISAVEPITSGRP